MSPRRTVLVVALGSVAIGSVAAAMSGVGPAEAVFLSVMIGTLVGVAAAVVRAVVDARRARHSAQRAWELADDELVAAAVAAERTRLAADIDQRLRAALAEVADVAAGAAEATADIGLAARSVHRISREATAELRRGLGMLRQSDGEPRLLPVTAAEVRHPHADLAIALGIAALAVGESLLYRTLGPIPGTGLWTVASVIAALTTIWWRRRPWLGAGLCAAVWMAAALGGLGVSGGFWVIATLGLLSFGAARDSAPMVAIAVLTLFPAAVVWSVARTDPDNAPITAVLLAIGTLAGLAVRWARGRADAARTRERSRTDAVRPALDAALAMQRGSMARELHDTVSHAVGVVAVQAAAARISWPAYPDRAREALAVAGKVAHDALAELGAIGVGAPLEATVADIVDRFRLAGLDVRFSDAEVPSALQPLFARIAQESLTNVLRHSGARQARVVVTRRGGTVRITISDAGNGSTAAPGYGLVGLRERTELAGGSLTTGPGPDGGFVLEASVPLERMST
ncbi:sensor histidine kinase [Microbacterium sp.]|uniref:sensor histidine kinase n=1 Tax=Microbacterium sp. TaxID=51671 RepID=UPI0039E65B62